MLRKLVCIAGTRPECLKLASVIRLGLYERYFDLQVLSSGQHPDMVAATLAHLELPLHHQLPRIPKGTLLSRSVAHLRQQIRDWLQENCPDVAIVQGDTSTAYAGALAAVDCGIPVAHLEAGLRTSTPTRPFPEEPFRRRIGQLARWHFAPTSAAGRNLQSEKIAPSSIHVVGNSIVDVLRETVEHSSGHPVEWRSAGKRLVVMTLHRRENYQQGILSICNTLLELLNVSTDLCLVCPVHPNPIVGTRVRRILGNHPRVILTEPLPYKTFIQLLCESSLVVTDSGGIQEEAPYLGLHVLIARTETERPEALAGGSVRLIGSNHHLLLEACKKALATPLPAPCGFSLQAPFGDGCTAQRVLAILQQDFPDIDATA